MTEYAAQIDAGIVNNIIVGNYVWANENLEGQWVDCTNNGELVAGIGFTWDGTNFVAPPYVPIEE